MALWDHVQSTSKDSAAGTSDTLAFVSNITAGNIIIVVARFGGTAQSPGFSDDKGNTYVKIEDIDDGAGDSLAVAYALNCAAGATTVTLTNASSVTRRWIILEYDAAGNTIAIDQHAHNTGTSTAPDSSSVTTVNASELLFGAAQVSNAETFTAGTSFTKRQEIAQKAAAEDRAVSSTGSYSASWTISASDTWAAAIVTFKIAASIPDIGSWGPQVSGNVQRPIGVVPSGTIGIKVQVPDWLEDAA